MRIERQRLLKIAWLDGWVHGTAWHGDFWCPGLGEAVSQSLRAWIAALLQPGVAVAITLTNTIATAIPVAVLTAYYYLQLARALQSTLQHVAALSPALSSNPRLRTTLNNLP